MSDTILGIIIGGSIALISTVIGAVVQGVISKRVTKLQIHARTSEQLTNIEYQREEIRMGRLIELRSKYLDPLTELVTKCYTLLEDISNDLITIQTQYGDPPDPQKQSFLQIPGVHSYHELVSNIEQEREELNESRKEIRVTASKTGDSTLLSLIHDAQRKMHYVCMDSFALRQSPFIGWFITSSETHMISLQSTLDKLNHAQTSLTSIHGRIEKLLTGSE